MWVVKPSCCVIFLMVTRKEWQSSQKGQLSARKKETNGSKFRINQRERFQREDEKGLLYLWTLSSVPSESFLHAHRLLMFPLARSDRETPYLVAFSLSFIFRMTGCSPSLIKRSQLHWIKWLTLPHGSSITHFKTEPTACLWKER